MRRQRTVGSVLFDYANVVILVVFCLTVVVPFVNVLSISLSSTKAINNAKVTLWPVGINLDNFRFVLKNAAFMNSFKVTLFVVVFGTALSLFFTLVTGYALSKKYLAGRAVFMLILLFAMVFQSPMIPLYLTVRGLGLLNTLLALVIPGSFSVFYTILCITFFRTLPEELFEAGRIDGMSEYGMLLKVAMPLSKPILATLLLYFAVNYWNSYQSALYYITARDLRPLQLYLWSLIAQSNVESIGASVVSEAAVKNSPDGLMMATVITATLPVMLVYPFLQGFFIKGTLVGSLKG